MLEYVKDAGLKFKRPLTRRTQTTMVILHHVEGEMTVQDIHKMHNNDTSKGYNGIAYNAYIDLDGTTYWGRGLEYQGGGTLSSLGLNPIAFQIVANGNFNVRSMPEAQKEAIIRLTRDVCNYYGITNIKGHREVGDTDCPGRNYPLDEIRNAALQKEEPMKPVNQKAAEEFIGNLYWNVLGREADRSGWDEWVSALLERRMTPEQVAYNFYFSDEEMKQKDANEDFIQELYRGLIGRDADADGLEYWSKGSYKDMSREDLFYAFVRSSEFLPIKEKMGF